MVGSLAALLAACGPVRPDVGGLGSTTTSTVGPVRTLRIGLLTGSQGSERAVDDGARLALSQASVPGSGVEVVVDAVSTGGTAAGAAAGARRLVADHVAAVIGPEQAAEVAAAERVLGPAGTPDVTVQASSALVPSAQWNGFFQAAADDAQQGVLVADRVVTDLGRTSVAVVSGPTPGARAVAGAAAAQVLSDGGTVVARSAPADATEVAASVAQIVGSDATAVIATLPGSAAVPLVSALTGAGYTGAVLLATGGPAAGLRSAALADPLGVTVASPADDLSAVPSPSGDALVFADAYRAAFGARPRAWAAQGYDAANAVLQAATPATGTPDVVATLQTGTWTGVASTLAFAPGGEDRYPNEYLSQVRDGAFVQFGRQR